MGRFDSFLSLALLPLLGTFFFGVALAAQSLQQLDSAIQESAFQRLAPSPKTGFIYNVTVDSSLVDAGVRKVQAVRLRSGSLKRHGLVFNEFKIPVQSVVESTSKYVVLIYREFSSSRYPTGLPRGYKLLGPVTGIKAYHGTNLSKKAAQAFKLVSGPTPITVRPALKASPVPPLCAAFKEPETFKLNNVSSPPNVCTLSQLVDLSLVIYSNDLAPAPSPTASAPLAVVFPPPKVRGNEGSRNGKVSSQTWKLIVAAVLAGVVLLMLVTLVILSGVRMKNRARIAKMEHCSENGESLQTALIGGRRAPAAPGTRTKPVLENEYLSP